MSAPQECSHRWFAAAWDWISVPGERALGRKVRAQLLGDLRGRVLEVGAGTGHNFLHYPAVAEVVATEPDPHMLQRARKRLAELGAKHIELRQAPAEELPFADESFDHVVSTLVLCTVRNVPRSLAEMRRVLRAGGTLRFWEHVRNDGSPFWGGVQDRIRPVWSWMGAGCQVNRRTERAIEDAGFRILSIERKRPMPIQPVIYGAARPV